jgi:serine/threonine protein kinase
LEPTSAPDRFERLNQILNDALELAPAEREPYILRACGDDETLRHSAQSLFAMMATVGDRTRTLSNAPSLKTGDVLEGGYRIVRMLGRGGMGEVYEAEDPEMDEHVAVKTIRPEIAADEASVARFRKEIQLGRKVSHPNVCNIYSIGKHGSLYFFTMELLTGETLSARIKKRGRMELTEALPLLSQMADALAAAHDAGIIHRDFKPANVMLLDGDTRRKAVVTDFGLARLVERPDSESRTGTTHFAGTPAYMAPEQLEDAPLTRATDIYALGLVAYEMVTARRPFEGTSDISAAIQRLTGKPVPPADWVPELDARWNTAILRCLEREPKDRWGSACDFVQALSSASAPVIVQEPRKAIRPKIANKHWWRWTSVALLTLAVVISVWILRKPPEVPPQAREWLDKGTAAVRDGVYWKATTALGQAIQTDPDLPIAYARRAEAWNEMDCPDKAAQDMVSAHAHEARISKLDGLYLDAINFTVANQFDDAVRAYQTILARLPEDQKHFGHVDLGRAYEKNAQPLKALEEYKAATQQWRGSPGAWLRRGSLERRLVRKKEAREDLNNALALFHDSGDEEGQAQAKSELARVSNGDEASKLLAEALALAGDNLNQQITIQSLQSLQAERRGDLEASRALATKAQALAEEKGMPVLAARGLNDLGNSLMLSGQDDDAAKYLRKVVNVANNYHARRLEYEARSALAQIALKTADETQRPAALKELTEAHDYFASHGDRSDAVNSDLIMAREERNTGKYKEAAARLLLAGKETDDATTQARVAGDLGKIRTVLEDYPAAISDIQRARALDQLAGFQQNLPFDDLHLATAAALLGDFKLAEMSLGLARQDGFKDSDLTGNRAELEMVRGRYTDAENLCSQVLSDKSSDAQDIADAQRIKGLCLLRSGHIGAGQAFCQEASAGSSHADQQTRMNASLALVLSEVLSGDARAALEKVRALEQELERNGQRSSLWRCRLYGAEAAEMLGDHDHARQFAASSLTNLNSVLNDWGPKASSTYLSRADIKADKKQLDKLVDR